MAEGGVSMLDRLSGNIVATKTAAGSKLSPGLTPVAGEVRGLPNTPAAFPLDVPQDVVRQMVVVLEAQRDSLDKVIASLNLLLGVPEVVEAEIAKDKATSKALLEREADRRAADVEKAAAGDKEAAKRKAKADANPMEQVVNRTAERDAAREALLKAMLAAQPAEVTQIVAEVESFETKFAAQQQAAQSAAFTQPPKVVPAVTGEGWLCPEHGATLIEPKVSPRGRAFRRCAVVGCREFEKV